MKNPLKSRRNKVQTLKVITLGCSKNTVDTAHLLYQLKDSYEILPADHEGPVDVLLINTCGFIGDAKQQSIDTILEAVGEGSAGRVLVFGCLSERYASELPDLIPEVGGWFGARDLEPLVKALGCKYRPEDAFKRVIYDGAHPYAFLKISEGCDRRCSYCAIPLIRGPHKSVPEETLVAEAESLAAQGVKELIVIAQDTTFYGLDLYGQRTLARLLRKLSAVDGISRIRLHYSYPQGFPEDVLDEMASNPKICKYIDIPLQHISDKVLSAMHRGIDGDQTRRLVSKMREKVPGVVLRTTMIVGHPGEGDAEFEELLDFVKEARFERLGAFTYSEEEGTFGADNLSDEVPDDVKKERLSRLMALQEGISLEYNQSRVGSVETVLVDDFTDGVFVCRSKAESPEVDGEILVRYSPMEFGDNPYSIIGEEIDVRITGCDSYDLIAEMVKL